MSLLRALVKGKGGLTRDMSAGDGFVAMPRVTTVATAGALTIGLDAILGGVAVFTGAAGAVAYTTPTAAAIIAALPHMNIGDTFVWILTNTAAQVATLTGGTGVTIAGIATANAASRIVVVEMTAATTLTMTGL